MGQINCSDDMLYEKKISEKDIFDGRVFKVKVRQIETPEGKPSSRELVFHNGGACVLPIDDEQNVYLVKQFRSPFERVLLEAPAGKIDPGEEPLTTENAEEIWNKANEMLGSGELSARKIMARSNVELICTTDDPADSLIWHEKIKDSGFECKVLPAFRPDNIVDIEKNSFNAYVEKLGKASDRKITSVKELKEVLLSRLDLFADHGCVISDHGTEYIWFSEKTAANSEDVFEKKMSDPDAVLSTDELTAYMTDLMLFFAREYAKRGWTMQLHFGCKRNVNRVLMDSIGVNCGCDIIAGSFDFVTPLTGFMDKLNSEGLLPGMIIYSLNPTDNTTLDVLCGAYNDGSVHGKIQHGAAWWFNDNLLGMEEHLKSLCTQSLLPCVVGMLTDSRCVLSYTRHEYFRRIFCNFLGTEVERGRFPDDDVILKDIVERVCYKNALGMFQ